MNLLLDTHAFLWWIADDGLDPRAWIQIADGNNEVVVSAASAWEIAIKRARGKLPFDHDITHAISASGFSQLPITASHAVAAGALPLHHHDPFDRMLLAQAQLEGLTLVTRDPKMQDYGVELLRC